MRTVLPLTLAPLAAAYPWAKRAEPARLVTPETEPSNIIPDQYIVKLNTDNPSALLDDISALSITPDQVYSSLFQGFSATLDAETLDALRSHPGVEYIEHDVLASTTEFTTQPGAPWGLARLSDREKGATSYVYDDSAGEGTCVYVIDTGVEIGHAEFGNRATFVATFVGQGEGDGHGHGTHVAGTIGSATYGVAKKTHIYSIKVLDSSGTGPISAVVAGMDRVATDYPTRSCPNGVIVNMSLGINGGGILSINEAVARLANDHDVFLAVAAGNSNTDVVWSSPAHSTGACAVGATDINDARAAFSNFGSRIAVLAPGVNITSTWIGGTTRAASGTSMAAPHVAGLGAYLSSLEGYHGGVGTCQRIKDLSTRDIVTNLPVESNPQFNTPNRLAFNGNPGA